MGLPTAELPTKNSLGKWFETMKPSTLVPQNIHEAQLAKRLGGSSIIIHPRATTLKNLSAISSNTIKIEVFSCTGKRSVTFKSDISTASAHIYSHPEFLGIAPGMYLYTISNKKGIIASGKLNKQY